MLNEKWKYFLFVEMVWNIFGTTSEPLAFWNKQVLQKSWEFYPKNFLRNRKQNLVWGIVTASGAVSCKKMCIENIYLSKVSQKPPVLILSSFDSIHFRNFKKEVFY